MERSRKFNVDIDSDEKKGYVGKVAGVGLLLECRVTKTDNNAVRKDELQYELLKSTGLTLEVSFRTVHPGYRFTSILS